MLGTEAIGATQEAAGSGGAISRERRTRRAYG